MKKNSLIFILGSCAYPTLEVLWRGYTHSSMPMNILGQICIPFSAIWFFLTIPATALCKLCGKAADHIFLPGKRNAAKRVTAP